MPILADEIYSGLVFGTADPMNPNYGKTEDRLFTPMFTVAVPLGVPVIGLGGLAKEFVVPGWRVGWATVHDTDEGIYPIYENLFSEISITLAPIA